MNAPFANQFLSDAGGYSASRFREDTFGFGEELNSGDDFGIRNVFSPPAALAYQLNRIRAIRRIADSQRARNSVGLLRLKAGQSALYGTGDWRATCSLRPEKSHRLLFHPAKPNQFAKRLGDFSDQRTAGHGHHNVVRQTPTKLLGNFKTMRLGALRVIRPQIDVHQA